jgi:glycerol 3-phosphate dehydrogenase (quinone) subunit B (EC 1.1.5.3)
MTDTSAVLRHLEELLGKRVFEIPTLPPSIAGPRLRAAFDKGLPGLGVRTCTQKFDHQR